MHNRCALLICASLLLAPQINAASSDELDARYNDCLEASEGLTNSLVAACAEGVSDVAKKQMNLTYQRLYLTLQQASPEDAKQLEEAQKAWLIYRNAHCDMQGKHIGSPMYYTCPMELNIDRLVELEFLLDNGG
ncbi:conserved exported hypothetical protein [Pseudomonas sp. 8BK]|uniref:lysozyme inhibitor LprI family protein n=1 Tax=Pseudomonas sp. 8BK TaxID=2653164 RepID=UPI0012F131CF|nr:lysozyme inhibitor LprI family protein [Pseudomonas sp. 8BK]VXB52231.1 conserved exported hypothetical protein [Pseudomonas sp. 8BK]